MAGAQAAVDEMARRACGDPDRIGIGGHSYGAFMTANLLAHWICSGPASPAAGPTTGRSPRSVSRPRSARCGKLPEIYFEMSPFMHAEKMDEPILLIHGEADNNSGTFPFRASATTTR